MNLWKRYVARRHRKAHERFEAERVRQKALAGHDVEEAVHEAALGSAPAHPSLLSDSLGTEESSPTTPDEPS